MGSRKKLKTHQHVVPRAYLRGWADADTQIAVRSRSEPVAVPRPLSHSAVRSRFYNHRDSHDLETDVVEDWLAQHIESPGSQVLRRLRGGDDAMEVDRRSLVNLVCAQLMRSPTVFAYMRQIDQHTGPLLAMAEACMHLGVNPVDLEDSEREQLLSEVRRAWLDQEDRDVRASMLRTMVRKVDELADTVKTWHWSVLTADDPLLVTGDTPVVTLDLNDEGGWNGLMPAGSPLWLPLSPQQLLVGDPTPPLTSNLVLTADMATFINRSLARQADEALFNYPDLPWPPSTELSPSKPALPTPTVTWQRQEERGTGRERTFPATFPEVHQASVRALLDTMGAQDTIE